MATKIATPTTGKHPKRLLLGVYAPYNKMSNAELYFEEFLSLVTTLDIEYDETMFLKLREVDNNRFLTKGKMEEVKEFCDSNEIEEIIFSDILTSLQERNLEDILHCMIFDRTQLILNIFKNSAKTSEGKIQVEMAEIEFMKTRVIGKGKEFAQQAGFIGGRGPGETYKEEIKRIFADKLRQSQKRLDILQRSRDVQRKQRVESNIPMVCIIGYTNAGKSSVLNIITKSSVLAEDKLFATLDTTTRELFIDGKKKCLISDTVGFISQLPPQLVAAFKSTLDELKYADLLIHVVDISNPAWKNQVEVVHTMLEELEVSSPMVYVFNKIDKLTPEELQQLPLALHTYQPQILVSTQSKEGIAPLVTFLRDYRFEPRETR